MYSVVENGVLIKFDERDLFDKENIFKIERYESFVREYRGKVFDFAISRDVFSITIHEGVIEIGEGAFKHLNSYPIVVRLHTSLKVIREDAFNEADLVEITFQEGLIKIGKNAFNETALWRKYVLPRSIEKIGDNAFFDTRIAEIELPTSLIDYGTFVLPADYSGYSDATKSQYVISNRTLESIYDNATIVQYRNLSNGYNRR